MKMVLTERKIQENPDRFSRVYISVTEEVAPELNLQYFRPNKVWKPLVEKELKRRRVKFSRLKWSSYANGNPGFIVSGHFGKEFYMDCVK